MNRLPTLQRLLLYATFLLLLATGIVWEALTPGPAAAMLMEIHGGIAMLALVLLGTLLVQHVPTGWISLKNRWSGTLLIGSLSWLAVSGYLLYYAGSESLRSFASESHLWIGLTACVIVALHIRRSAAIT